MTSRWACALTLGPLGFLLLACSSTPRVEKAPSAPTIETAVTYFSGSPLAGPRPGSQKGGLQPVSRAAKLLRARCELHWFESMPTAAVAGGLGPLASHTKLVLAARGEEPILPSAYLLSAMRVGLGEVAKSFLAAAAKAPLQDEVLPRERERQKDRMPRSKLVNDASLIVPPNVTASFVAFAAQNFELADEGQIRKRLQLQVSASPEQKGLQVTLIVEDLWAKAPDLFAPGEAQGQPGPASTASLQRELIVLAERVEAGAGPMLLLFPSPLQGDEGRAWGLVIRAEEVERAAVATELATCQQALAKAAAAARLLARRPSKAEIWQSEVQEALRALGDARSRRSALRFLATRAAAPLSEDLALEVEDAALADFVLQLQGKPAASGKPSALGKKAAPAKKAVAAKPELSPQTLPWFLESHAWNWLVTAARAGKLGDVLEAILLRRAGEVGRYPSTLASMCKRARSLADFDAKLVAENRLLLEDGNPASRVRAFDWLAARGQKPEGFDPLADSKARKAALKALEEAAEARELAEANKAQAKESATQLGAKR